LIFEKKINFVNKNKKKMNQIRKKNIIEENIATQATTSTDFSKRNKIPYYKTFYSNFSDEQNKNQIQNKNSQKMKIVDSVKKNKKNMKFFSPIRNIKNIEDSPNKKRSKTFGEKSHTQKKETNKNKNIPIRINSLLPTNINLYQHLIKGSDFGIYDNLNWTLRLRDCSHKGLYDTKVDYKNYYYHRDNKEKNEEKKQEKIKLTENFNPPSYYEEDLKKYKKRMKTTSKSLITQLNPNYNTIKHLLFGNNQGKVNFSQFIFETTLRNSNGDKNSDKKKWEILPAVKNNNKKYLVKYLSPITQQGIQNLRNIEKFLHKNYEYSYEDAIVGNDKIKKKVIYNNRNYTIGGIGDSLGEEKYNNHFGDNNMFANKEILSTASNTQCKFELGLRLYGPYKDKKFMTQNNFRPKKKK
jgi:hypothetical protein